MWMMYRLVSLSLLEWKLLVKMKNKLDVSLGTKTWNTFFYFPRDNDVGTSWVL